MLWNLDFGWLVLAFGTVIGIAYMMSLMIESSIGREGFGPMGNATIITVGFFGTILLANHQGINLRELKDALIYGLGGAFALMLVAVLLRAIFRRMYPS